jgi:hypothetical protein
MLKLIPLFCPIAIWLVLLFFFTALFLVLAQARGRLRKLHRIPCSRCAFSTGDYRLKCAVHPVRAFSEDAINCRDFQGQIPKKKPVNRSIKINLEIVDNSQTKTPIGSEIHCHGRKTITGEFNDAPFRQITHPTAKF